MNKVFCFGELLLRLSPVLNRQWLHENQLPVYIGGAELNVAAALARWQVPVKYCTALPDHYLSHEIAEELRAKQIDTSAIVFSGERIGTYYMPQGADLKNASVIYDRKYSSFYELEPGMLNWDQLLEGCSWFHFTAISPAINAQVAAVCKEGLEAAKARGMTISVDLNYRAKLWQYGKQPQQVMPELVQYCQVLMGNLWAAETLLGIETGLPSNETVFSNEALIETAGNSMLRIHKAYPALTTMAYTFRMEKEYFAVLQHGADRAISKTHPLMHIVDKAGSGDCFMGGLICNLINKQSPQQTIDFAAAAAVGKMQEKGDITQQSAEEIIKRIS